MADKKDGYTEDDIDLLGTICRRVSPILHARLQSDAQERRRLQVEEERRHDEERLRLQSAALDSAANTVVMTDREGHITWVNGAFTELTGYTLEEVIGRTPRILASGQQSPAFYAWMWETILEGGVWHGDLVNRRKDGGLYTEEMTITPVRGDAGMITHFIAIKQDITNRLYVEEQLRQAQKMEAIGQLAAGVAHDFNNILMPILTYGSMLRDELDPTSNLFGYAQQIVEAGERAAGLPRQLLAFSRKQVLQPKVLDLNDLLSGLQKMLSRIIGEDIELLVRPGDNLGHVLVDPGQLEQVVLNLVVNARDAMPQGGTLTLATADLGLNEEQARGHPGARPGQYVVLSVSDTGCGMDAATQERIFEPFFTTKERGKGTGLGLSTVIGIVTQSAGFIRIQSEVGRGSTFAVHLPCVASNTEDEDACLEAEAARGGSETVLVVEDDDSVRSVLETCLGRLGYTVLSAPRGEEVVSICSQHGGAIDLLVTDVVLPGMGGGQIAAVVSTLRPGVKVLYISGYTDDAMVRHGVSTAEASFIQKPFRFADLARAVRAVLDTPKS